MIYEMISVLPVYVKQASDKLIIYSHCRRYGYMPMMEITGGKKLRNQTGDAVSAMGVDK